MAMNQVQLMGNLTRDPDLVTFQSGKTKCNFSIAVSQDYVGSDGNRGVDYIDCVAWRSQAEFISKYFAKGSPIVVCGRLSAHTYTDRDNIKRKQVEVVVENAYFAGGKKKGTGEPDEAPADDNDFTDLPDPDGEDPF